MAHLVHHCDHLVMAVPCAACGHPNRDTARFCASCGTHLPRCCPRRDAELPDGARFCDSCGTLVEPAEVDAGAADSGARKLVTVLFADLVGSTGAQELMDPEAVRTANERAYSSMRAAVEGHGGTVVKFVGDGMMAAFGVPEVSDDDALRALAAAAELRETFRTGMRIGVNTGEVVVSPDDQDVMGDAINVASRLEHEAPPGGVLVGEETYRLTRGSAIFGGPRLLTVKGRAAPVEARVLTELCDSTVPAPAVFVGRDRELATLVGALGTAAGTSRARLVTVVGSPGVGKSRLLDELVRAVDDEATVLVGRCDAGGASSAEPVTGILRGALEASGGLAGLAVDASERARIAAAVDALTGVGAEGTPQEMFWAVRRVIEMAARRRPTLVVLDDLHWAEPVLLDLVEHLVEWLGPVPVLLVAAGRPELRELRPTLVEAGSGAAAVVSLEGLDAEATRELAADLLGASGLPAELVSRVVDATDGNPLFVRELLRMLVDDGVLRQEDGQWGLTIEASDIEVPSTISALLGARIERLPADERTTLERASVLGQEVVQGALLELLPPAVRARTAGLFESLRRKELLEPARTYWEDQPVLRFHHVLIRDAAYRRVLKGSRADLHERAARWFREKTGDAAEHDELVGYHLEQSLQSRRDLGDLDDHARAIAADAGTRLGRAARRALDRDDLAAAAALAGRALGCLPEDDPDRPELLLVRCEALLDTGDVTSGREAVDELAALTAGNERLGAWATAFSVQAGLLSGTATLTDAEARALAAAAVLASLGDATGAAKAHRVHAAVLARLGRIADTEVALDRALTAARQAGDRRQISGVLAAAPPAALWGPSPVTRAGGRCLDVVRLLRITTGAREVEAISIRCQAVLEALRGRRDAALTMLGRARQIVEELGLRRGILDLELAAGQVDLIGREPPSAEEHLQVADTGYQAMGLDADAAQAAALRARVALLEHRDDAALELSRRAAVIAGSDLKTAVTWRAVMADVLARRGERDAALALAREAVALTETTDDLLDHGEALASLAGVLQATGDSNGARDARERASDLYEQKGATALAGRIGSPPSSPSGRWPDVAPNRAAHSFETDQDVIANGTPEEIRKVLHPDFVHEDRRPGPWERVMDRERVIESIEVARAMQSPLLRCQVVSTQGDDLVLLHQVYGRDGVENEFLSLAQYDESGRCVRSILFDIDDSAAAIAEMARLANSAGDPDSGPDGPTVALSSYSATLAQLEALADAERGNVATASFRDLNDAMVALDWVTVRGLLAPGFVCSEERNGITVSLDAEQILAELEGTEYRPTGVRIEPLETRGASVALVRGRYQSTTSSFESVQLHVIVVDGDGRITRAFNFRDDGMAEALEALERADSISPGPDHVAASDDVLSSTRAATGSDAGATVTRGRHDRAGRNRAVEVNEANLALAAAGRWEDLRSSARPDFVMEDRRSVPREPVMSSDRAVAGAMAGDDVQPQLVSSEVVAVGGDLVALMRQSFSVGSFMSEWLALLEIDEAGRSVHYLQFDVDALDEALAELDRRAAEGANNLVVRSQRRTTDLAAAGRWEEFRALYHQSYRFVDQRPGTRGETADRDATLVRYRDSRALGLTRSTNEVVAERGARLALLRNTSQSDDGFEVELLVLSRCGHDGRIDLQILFSPEDLDAAMSTLDELASADGAEG